MRRSPSSSSTLTISLAALLATGLATASQAATPHDNGGTPDAFFVDLPPLPKDVDDASKRFTADAMAVFHQRIDGHAVPLDGNAGGAPSQTPDPELAEFMRGWPQVGLAEGEKIYAFVVAEQRLDDVDEACGRAESAREVADHHPGYVACANAFLSGVAPLWPDYLGAVHGVVVAKGDYIARFRAKARSAAFKRFLDGQAQGLWIHASNALAQLEAIAAHANVPAN